MPKSTLRQQLETANAEIERMVREYNSKETKVRELEQNVSRLESERNEARWTLDKETKRMRKEVEAAQARFRQSERNLQRALGYIDRVTEGEPPLPGVEGAPARGPVLEQGEPYD